VGFEDNLGRSSCREAAIHAFLTQFMRIPFSFHDISQIINRSILIVFIDKNASMAYNFRVGGDAKWLYLILRGF